MKAYIKPIIETKPMSIDTALLAGSNPNIGTIPVGGQVDPYDSKGTGGIWDDGVE